MSVNSAIWCCQPLLNFFYTFSSVQYIQILHFKSGFNKILSLFGEFLKNSHSWKSKYVKSFDSSEVGSSTPPFTF